MQRGILGRTFQSKNNDKGLGVEAVGPLPRAHYPELGRFPPKLFIARELSKVLTKPIIMKQGIGAPSPMLGPSDWLAACTIQYPDAARILK